MFRKLTPAPLRGLIGRAVSRGVMLHRDSADVRETWKNLAPVVLAKGWRLGARRPTVAAVFVGRNDDYVPDNEARIRAMIEWNSRVMCDEMIFVEWNPPADRPLLSPALARDFPHLRCYVVPPEVHARVCDHPRMVIMEELGKNVGVRRARSEYVCVTNAYIFWDGCVRRLARLLDENLIFRTRRIEWRWDGRPVTQRSLTHARNRVDFRRGWRQELDYGCGDFMLAHRELWQRAGGFDESLRATRIHADGRGLFQLVAVGGKPVHLGLHYHIFHESSSTQSAGEFTVDSRFGAAFAYRGNLPYRNPPTWGLADYSEEPVAERVWKLIAP
ncbi:MAG: hypothetical protein ABR554_17125 [Pyrinomonadaceae bacterium]